MHSEQVQQLEERLAELEEERKELAKFQQIDKQRRSLEFAIYDKELAETRAKLEQVPPRAHTVVIKAPGSMMMSPEAHDHMQRSALHWAWTLYFRMNLPFIATSVRAGAHACANVLCMYGSLHFRDQS